MDLYRRELLKAAGAAGIMFMAPRLRAEGKAAQATQAAGGELKASWDWIRTCRTVIFEAYNPPFYPALDYNPAKSIEICKQLNANCIRYPAASYYAYFPTKSGYPVHPEMKTDIMKETLALARKAGLKTMAYVPLNHPFMEVTSKNPNFLKWAKKTPGGQPMITEHYGYVPYYEGCLNSPVGGVIRQMVREVVRDYDFDVIYFDGPYMGMKRAPSWCYCEHCQAAYKQRFGKPIPPQDKKYRATTGHEDEVQYVNWLANEVVIKYLKDVREEIRTLKDVPVLFNDTSLLSPRQWRNRAIPVTDGFMFELAETPEDKLFNLMLGHSTGKVIWTYVGTHTQFHNDRLRNEKVRGWFSYPVESEELLMDGATAIAGGAGLKYWGVSRFGIMPEGPLAYESGKHIKYVFDMAAKHEALLKTLRPQPLAGVMVSPQTIDFFRNPLFLEKKYQIYPRGAWHAMKDLGYDAEPFLDYLSTPEQIARYKLLYLPAVGALSDAQCKMIRDYVANGGTLIATSFTSMSDEVGRMRPQFGLADLFGVEWVSHEPVEIPDLYLKLPDGKLVPHDVQVLRVKKTDGEVLAEVSDVGHRANLGPGVVRRKVGKGQVIYISGGLEAIYGETRMKAVRSYLASLVDPVLDPHRTYRMSFMSGITPHLMASDKTLLLHLIANIGVKVKRFRVKEEFNEVRNVKVAVRVPQGRRVKAVSLLRSGQKMSAAARGGWVEVTIPRLLIHEAVKVDLA